jgi:hypothetical protein
VLQTVLSLLEMDLAVFLLGDCVFSSELDTSIAMQRMRDSGAVVLTYKSLYYELRKRVQMGEQPEGLPAPAELPPLPGR